MDYDLVYRAPCTALGVCFTADAVTRVAFLPLSQHPQTNPHPFAREIIRQLDAYFLDDAMFRFTLPIMLAGTAYQQGVWQAIAMIPTGQVCTYSDIAGQLHSGPRAVANACGRNPLPVLIPCHRVVGVHGLGGFNRGKTEPMLAIKRWLLQHESRR